MTIEEEKDLAKVVEQAMKHTNDKNVLKTSLTASLRLFYSMGYRSGYEDGMNDTKNGKDQRVIAHLN